MTMPAGKYPTPTQYQKVVLRIGLQEDKNDPTVNAEERSIILWHADIAVPKCAGSEQTPAPGRPYVFGWPC